MEELFRVEGEVLWIMVPKELDHHSCIEIRENADGIMLKENIKEVVFDFSNTEFMDSSGIGLLVGRYRKVHSFGGQVLVCNVTGHMAKILQLSGIEKFIGKYEGTI